MEKYYLLKWESNWADEMDISGFIVLDSKKYDKFKKKIDAFKNEKRIDNKDLSIFIGSNQEMYFKSKQALLNEIVTCEISKDEYETFKKHFSQEHYNEFLEIQFGFDDIFSVLTEYEEYFEVGYEEDYEI